MSAPCYEVSVGDLRTVSGQCILWAFEFVSCFISVYEIGGPAIQSSPASFLLLFCLLIVVTTSASSGIVNLRIQPLNIGVLVVILAWQARTWLPFIRLFSRPLLMIQCINHSYVHCGLLQSFRTHRPDPGECLEPVCRFADDSHSVRGFQGCRKKVCCGAICTDPPYLLWSISTFSEALQITYSTETLGKWPIETLHLASIILKDSWFLLLISSPTLIISLFCGAISTLVAKVTRS